MNIKEQLNIKQDMLNNENYTLLLKFKKYFKLYIFTVYLYSKETILYSKETVYQTSDNECIWIKIKIVYIIMI